MSFYNVQSTRHVKAPRYGIACLLWNHYAKDIDLKVKAFDYISSVLIADVDTSIEPQPTVPAHPRTQIVHVVPER